MPRRRSSKKTKKKCSFPTWMVLGPVMILSALIWSYTIVFLLDLSSSSTHVGEEEEFHASVAPQPGQSPPSRNSIRAAALPAPRLNSNPKSNNNTTTSTTKTTQLLGILITTGNLYTLELWLHRHVSLFERLVIVHGDYLEAAASHRQFVLQATHVYPNIRVVRQTKRMSKITDQSIRKLAMPSLEELGSINGRWIMLCHADEFWTVDPRKLVQVVSAQSDRVNVIRVQSVTASPLESAYQQLLKEQKVHGLQYHKFDILSFSQYTSHHNWTFVSSQDGKLHFDMPSNVDRLFQWNRGTTWGHKETSMVIPKTMKPGRLVYKSDAFFVHFALHDFSDVDAVNATTGYLRESRLETKLPPHHQVMQPGWQRGVFQDVSDAETLSHYPPKLLAQELAERHAALHKPPNLPILPWTNASAFGTKVLQ